MSNEANDSAKPTAASGPGRVILLLLAVSIGLFAGGVLGVLFAGPLLAKRAVANAESVNAHAPEEEHAEKSEKGGHGAEETSSVYPLENLVLNPANSGGTRFLVASLALAVHKEELVATLEQRDAEVRDVVLRVLGTKTVGELSDTQLRPQLKEELQAAVDSLFQQSTISAVYFPQFVIQ